MKKQYHTAYHTPYNTRILLRFIALLYFLFILPIQHANSIEPANLWDTIEMAKTYLKQKKPDKAYAVLVPFEIEYAGSIDFDYILGIAALDSGHPAKATLVFERILRIQPNYAGARLDLGRAYFAMGNYDMAKKEFVKVLSLDPPPLAKKTTIIYLEAVKRQQNRKRALFTCYSEIKAGYDTNINTSTSESEIYTPALQLPLNLDENNIQKEDGYFGYGAGFNLKQKLPGKLFWRFNGNTVNRSYLNEITFDPWNFDITNGFGYETNTNIFQLNVSCGLSLLGNNINKERLSGGLEWRHALNSNNLLTTFGQYSVIRFPEPELEIENFNQTIAGLSWLHKLDWLNKSLLVTSVYGGMEEEVEGRANGDKDFGGLIAGIETSLMQRLTFFAGAGGYFGNYDQENNAFLEKREDRQFDAQAGVKWMLADNISVNPQINYIQNNSNISLYEYSRTDFSVTFRYDL